MHLNNTVTVTLLNKTIMALLLSSCRRKGPGSTTLKVWATLQSKDRSRFFGCICNIIHASSCTRCSSQPHGHWSLQQEFFLQSVFAARDFHHPSCAFLMGWTVDCFQRESGNSSILPPQGFLLTSWFSSYFLVLPFVL